MLESKGLGQRYGKGPWLFNDLSLRVSPGEIVMVLGPNARGKTTLLKTLCGLLPPACGSVVHEGVVGYVPQAHQANLGYPVIEMVIMGRASKLRAYQNPGKRDREIAQGALDRVGLGDLAPKPFDQLSGGQRQLVLVARALAAEPTILALDEPTSALDLRNQAVVLRVVQQLRDEGLGLIITTHDPAHAYHVADRVLLLETGVQPVIGDGSSLLTSERLSSLYRTPIIVSSVPTDHGFQNVVVPYLEAPRPSA